MTEGWSFYYYDTILFRDPGVNDVCWGRYLLFNKTTGLPDDCSSTDYPYYCFNSTILKQVHTRIASIEPIINGTSPVAVVAIIYSEQTRYRYGSYDRSSYLALLEAIFTTYSNRSVSVLVLSSLDLTNPSALSGLTLLILPETSGLTVDQLAGLHHWVMSGGTVLVTGDALRFNATGQENSRGQFAVSWLGVQFRGTNCWAAAHKWELNWTTADGDDASEQQSNAVCINQVAPAAGTVVAVSGIVPEVTPGGPFAVLTRTSVGRGKACYLAFKYDNSIGQGWPSRAGEANITVPAIVDAVDRLCPEQPLRILSPAGARTSSAAVLTQQPSHQRWILHFLTADLLEVELSARHINASAIVQIAPASGWNVTARQSPTGGLVVQVLSIGSARDAFRLVVLKTDESEMQNSAVNLTVRRQHKSRTGRFGWRITDEVVSRQSNHTALVIIDMWAKYWWYATLTYLLVPKVVLCICDCRMCVQPIGRAVADCAGSHDQHDCISRPRSRHTGHPRAIRLPLTLQRFCRSEVGYSASTRGYAEHDKHVFPAIPIICELLVCYVCPSCV
eukprot:COSAG01_NODE_1566_length_9890_cov_4.685323_8_plen_561_part_00